jgi:hypothetical protein
MCIAGYDELLNGPVDRQGAIRLFPAQHVRQADESGRNGEKSGQTGWNGGQQTDNQPLDESILSIVPVPVSLRFVGNHAQHYARRQGEQRAGSQGCHVAAKKHCVNNDGKKYNSRIESEDLTKSSLMESGLMTKRGKNSIRPALRRDRLRSGAGGLAANRAESAGLVNLGVAMSASNHSHLLRIRFLAVHVQLA